MFYEALDYLGRDVLLALTAVVALAGFLRLPLRGDPFRLALVVTAYVVSVEDLVAWPAAISIVALAAAPSLPSRWLPPVGVAAAGVLLWTTAPELGDRWTPALVAMAVVVAVAVPVTATAAASLGQTPAAALMVVSALGVFGGPPDTEITAAVFFFLAVATVASSWSTKGWNRPAPWSAAAFVGLLGWAALHGSIGRLAAFPGAVGCLGLFVVGPCVDPALRGRREMPFAGLVARAAVHSATAYACGRVAALRTDVTQSVVITVSAWLLLAVSLVVIGAVERRMDGGRGRCDVGW